MTLRYLVTTALLVLVLAAAPGMAAAQTQSFEDLVEDALERGETGAPGQSAPESAVPPRLRVLPQAGGTSQAPAQPAPTQAPAAAAPAQPRLFGTADQPPKPYTPPRPAQPAVKEAPEAGATAGTSGFAEAPSEAAAPAASAEGDPAVTPTDPAAAQAPVQPPANAAASEAPPSAGRLRVEEVNAATFSEHPEDIRGATPIMLKAQILLDRAGASPGVIDGIYGSNVAKAVAAVEAVLNLPVDGRLDPNVWSALGGDQAPPVLVEYTITPEDAAYPFLASIPADYAVQATLPALGFTSPEEMFGERFHMDVKLLSELNPGADFRQAGATIIVADIEGQPITGKIARIEADKAKRQVRAYDAGNRLVVAYPATIGSADNPSPSGTHQVNAIAANPVYYYDPENFVQGENRQPLELPPGPNNPVGTMWIDLSEPSYGIHGTPEPSKIDKTGSHGCVRLTNWDAEELATLVDPGVTVHFVE